MKDVAVKMEMYIECALLECDGISRISKMVYKTRFKQDVVLMKRIYEISNRKNRYKVEEYKVFRNK